MRYPSRPIFSYVTAAVLLMCTTQALPVNESIDEKDDLALRNTTVDNATADQLAKAAYEKLLSLQRGANNTGDVTGGSDVLDLILNAIRKKKVDVIPMPDVQGETDLDIKIGTVHASYTGHNGWLRSLLTVARRGPAEMRLEGPSVIVRSSLGLDTMEVGMDVAVKTEFMSPAGHIDAKVARNTFEFEGSFGYHTGTCEISLRYFKVADMSGISIDMTGFGMADKMVSKLATYLAAQFPGQIWDIVEKHGREFIEKNLSKMMCPFEL